MKNSIKFFGLILTFFYALSCKNDNVESQIENSVLNPLTLSKDSDFNNLLKSISKLEEHIISKSVKLSKKELLENSNKINDFLAKGNNLDAQDLKGISNLFGYSDVSLFTNDLKESQKLGEKLANKYSSLKSDNNNKLITDAIQQTFINKSNNLSNLRVGSCNQKMLAACMAGAYGAYVVVVTSNCPGAAVLWPWGVGACVAGATVAYGAALYTCGDNYGCNQ